MISISSLRTRVRLGKFPSMPSVRPSVKCSNLTFPSQFSGFHQESAPVDAGSAEAFVNGFHHQYHHRHTFLPSIDVPVVR